MSNKIKASGKQVIQLQDIKGSVININISSHDEYGRIIDEIEQVKERLIEIEGSSLNDTEKEAHISALANLLTSKEYEKKTVEKYIVRKAYELLQVDINEASTEMKAAYENIVNGNINDAIKFNETSKKTKTYKLKTPIWLAYLTVLLTIILLYLYPYEINKDFYTILISLRLADDCTLQECDYPKELKELLVDNAYKYNKRINVKILNNEVDNLDEAKQLCYENNANLIYFGNIQEKCSDSSMICVRYYSVGNKSPVNNVISYQDKFKYLNNLNEGALISDFNVILNWTFVQIELEKINNSLSSYFRFIANEGDLGNMLFKELYAKTFGIVDIKQPNLSSSNRFEAFNYDTIIHYLNQIEVKPVEKYYPIHYAKTIAMMNKDTELKEDIEGKVWILETGKVNDSWLNSFATLLDINPNSKEVKSIIIHFIWRMDMQVMVQLMRDQQFDLKTEFDEMVLIEKYVQVCKEYNLKGLHQKLLKEFDTSDKLSIEVLQFILEKFDE